MSYIEMANHPFLWIVAGIVVVNAIVQALLYLFRAIKTAKAIGVTKQQINGAIRASIITTVPPSIAMGAALLALMNMIGKPIAWSRLSVIGALVYESMVATLTAAYQGLSFETMTPEGFVVVLFCMALATSIWQIMPMLFAPSYGKMYSLLARGDVRRVGAISVGAIVGVVVALSYTYVNPNTLFSRTFWATLLGAATMVVGHVLAKKFPKAAGWLNEWVFTAAMFIGMFGSLLFPA